MALDSKTPLYLLDSRLNDWMSISAFETVMQDYFVDPGRPHAEIEDYHAKRGALKKLRDEVVPVLHYLEFIKAEGEIRFELNDGVPDCWVRNNPHEESQGIEVTVALPRAALLGQGVE